MREQMNRFLDDVDRALVAAFPGQTLDVYHIGRSALIWEYGALSTTEDIDVLRTAGSEQMLGFVLKGFGPGTVNASKHGLYLQAVPPTLPPMPSNYQSYATLVDGSWLALRLYHLEPNDLAVSKLKRFAPRDREDIRFLCDRGLLNESVLQARLENAFQWHTDKDGNPDRDAAFAHLALVQQYLRGEIGEL